MNDPNPLTHDAFVRGKVRDAIRSAKIPKRAPDRVWGGLGTGVRCHICDAPIHSDQTELELEFILDDRSKSVHHLVHLRCFSAFEVERELADAAVRATVRDTPASPPNGDGLSHLP